MDDETLLLIGLGAAVVIGGISFGNVGSGIVDPVADVAHDVTGVLPWLESEVDQFENWVGGWL